MNLPSAVEICEVGPRDGFQFERKRIPTDLKVEIIEGLADAGVRRIQVTSFVHPGRVPQMSDAEDVVARLSKRTGLTYSALALNTKGVQRAAEAGVQYIDLSIATNEEHGRSNANMSVAEGAEHAVQMIELSRSAGMIPQIGLQTVFGYAEPGDTPIGRILKLAERFCALDVESLSLADSTGMANPRLIREVVGAVQPVAADVPIVLHLHDTRGLGLANVVAALECGVSRFDTSLGGLGGCPFIPGATGNIATEDTVYLLEALGVETRIDLAAVARLSKKLEDFRGAPLSGKMYRLTG